MIKTPIHLIPGLKRQLSESEAARARLEEALQLAEDKMTPTSAEQMREISAAPEPAPEPAPEVTVTRKVTSEPISMTRHTMSALYRQLDPANAGIVSR